MDFESPNSSDARIPKKDVLAYLEWNRSQEQAIPYLVITWLPHQVIPKFRGKKDWQLLYTSPGQYNAGHGYFRARVESPPFRYWYGFYRRELEELIRAHPSLAGLPLYFGDLDGLDFSFEDPM